MAVTLTSTGITFSDGTSQTSAAAGASAGAQIFNASGTWNRSSAGDPDSVVITAVGGGAGAGYNQSGYQQNTYPKGGSGGTVISAPVAVSGNTAVTVGAGGTSSTYGNSGGNSSFGNAVSANGGARSYSASGTGTDGNINNSFIEVAHPGKGSRGTGAQNKSGSGTTGAVVVVW